MKERHFHLFGIDAGFRKTGVAVVRVSEAGDELVEALTLLSDDSDLPVVMDADMSAVFSVLGHLEDLRARYKPNGAFIEMPHGGSQSSRASHCMGMAKSFITSFLFYNGNIGFEAFSPADVEHALGIHLTKGALKELGLKKGEAGKWKKERMESAVRVEWPEFDGWPEKKLLAEDAYDAAAAFMCGRAANCLYARLKERFGLTSKRGGK